MNETRAAVKPYAERMVTENEAVRLWERRAVTGPEPTIEQLMSLTDDRVTKYARFRIEGRSLILRWYEPKDKTLSVPVLDVNAADPAAEAERYAAAVEEWAAQRREA